MKGYKSLYEELIEQLEIEGKIKVINTWDLLTEEEKQNYGANIPRPNMLNTEV